MGDREALEMRRIISVTPHMMRFCQEALDGESRTSKTSTVLIETLTKEDLCLLEVNPLARAVTFLLVVLFTFAVRASLDDDDDDWPDY